MDAVALDSTERAALERLAADLTGVFGTRLESIVAYGAERPLHTLVLADQVTFQDLAACVPLVDRWHREELATPLVLSRREFLRTLDVFPVEYGAIIDDHEVVVGTNPFAGCAVCDADLRRAVELQAKSHLIHLREGYLEVHGRPDGVARLLASSAPAYRALVHNLGRLAPEAIGDGTGQLLTELQTMNTIADPSALLARYVTEVDRIWGCVDGWRDR
jgi:hypothetical protein